MAVGSVYKQKMASSASGGGGGGQALRKSVQANRTLVWRINLFARVPSGHRMQNVYLKQKPSFGCKNRRGKRQRLGRPLSGSGGGGLDVDHKSIKAKEKKKY